MNWHIQILILAFLCIRDASLEIDDNGSIREPADYDLQEKNLANLPTKSQSNGLLDNEYQKIEPQSNEVAHKTPYMGLRNPMRKYHKRSGKAGRMRRIPAAVENSNIVQSDPVQEQLKQQQMQRELGVENINGEAQNMGRTPDEVSMANHLPFKKHIMGRRRPFRRLRKFRGFKGNGECYQPMNEEDTGDDFESNSEIKNGEVADLRAGGYVLVPEQNQLILLKNLNFTKAIPVLGNEHFDNMEQGDQGFVMTIESGPRLNELRSNVDATPELSEHLPKCHGMRMENGKHTHTGDGNGSDGNGKDDADGDDDQGSEPEPENDNVEHNLEIKLKEEIMNCTENGLQKYLKRLKNKGDTRSSGKSDTKMAENGNEETLSDEDKANLMNLNITIHGVVMNDDKPSKIHGNGTIKVHPGYAEERERRAINIPFFKKKNKYSALQEEDSQDDTKEETKDEAKDATKDGCTEDGAKADSKMELKVQCKPENAPRDPNCKSSAPKGNGTCEDSGSPDAGLTPDKLSNEIVKMVSHMVRSNPQMKTLWPSLKRNKPMNKGAACNLRSMVKCSSRKQVEDMLRKAMASVNEIIQKEVQARSCVPLSEDLAEFYEVILEMHAKQAKKKEEREELMLQAENLDKDQEKKNKHCKPNPRVSDAEADFADNALFDLMHTRRLQFDNEMAEARRRREAEKRTRELVMDTANSNLVRKLHEMYSPAFLKLSNIVESMQRTEVVPE